MHVQLGYRGTLTLHPIHTLPLFRASVNLAGPVKHHGIQLVMQRNFIRRRDLLSIFAEARGEVST